jgi:hypothetical protein
MFPLMILKKTLTIKYFLTQCLFLLDQIIAALFGQRWKTVVIDPLILSPDDQNQYYRVLETPVKTALKKASKQLRSASTNGSTATKVAIVINNK